MNRDSGEAKRSSQTGSTDNVAERTGIRRTSTESKKNKARSGIGDKVDDPAHEGLEENGQGMSLGNITYNLGGLPRR